MYQKELGEEVARLTLLFENEKKERLISEQKNNQEVGAILSVTQDSLYKAKCRLGKKLPQAIEGELDAFIRET